MFKNLNSIFILLLVSLTIQFSSAMEPFPLAPITTPDHAETARRRSMLENLLQSPVIFENELQISEDVEWFTNARIPLSERILELLENRYPFINELFTNTGYRLGNSFHETCLEMAKRNYIPRTLATRTGEELVLYARLCQQVDTKGYAIFQQFLRGKLKRLKEISIDELIEKCPSADVKKALRNLYRRALLQAYVYIYSDSFQFGYNLEKRITESESNAALAEYRGLDEFIEQFEEIAQREVAKEKALELAWNDTEDERSTENEAAEEKGLELAWNDIEDERSVENEDDESDIESDVQDFLNHETALNPSDLQAPNLIHQAATQETVLANSLNQATAANDTVAPVLLTETNAEQGNRLTINQQRLRERIAAFNRSMGTLSKL